MTTSLVQSWEVHLSRTSGGGSFENFARPSSDAFTLLNSPDTDKDWKVNSSIQYVTQTSTSVVVHVKVEVTYAGTSNLQSELDFDNFLDYTP